MEVVIRYTADKACEMVARMVAYQIQQKPESVLGLATGRTMEKVYARLMEEHLFRHLNFDLRNTHLPDGTAQDLKAEARAYEEKIRACGGIDL